MIGVVGYLYILQGVTYVYESLFGKNQPSQENEARPSTKSGRSGKTEGCKALAAGCGSCKNKALGENSQDSLTGLVNVTAEASTYTDPVNKVEQACTAGILTKHQITSKNKDQPEKTSTRKEQGQTNEGNSVMKGGKGNEPSKPNSDHDNNIAVLKLRKDKPSKIKPQNEVVGENAQERETSLVDVTTGASSCSDPVGKVDQTCTGVDKGKKLKTHDQNKKKENIGPSNDYQELQGGLKKCRHGKRYSQTRARQNLKGKQRLDSIDNCLESSKRARGKRYSHTRASKNLEQKVKPRAVTTASPCTVLAMQQRGVTSSAVNHQATPLTNLDQSAVMAAAPIHQWPIDYLLPDNSRFQRSILVNHSQDIPIKTLYQMPWHMEYELSAYDENNICTPFQQQSIILPICEPNMQKTYPAEALAVVPTHKMKQNVPAPNIHREPPMKTPGFKNGEERTSQEISSRVVPSTETPRELAIQPATCTVRATTASITPTAAVPLKHQQTNISHAVEGVVQNPDQVTSPTDVPPTKIIQENATPTTASITSTTAAQLKHQQTNINLAVEGVVQNPDQVTSPTNVPPTKVLQEKATPTTATKISMAAAPPKQQQANINLAFEVVQNPDQVTSPTDVPPTKLLQEKATPTTATKTSMAAAPPKQQQANINLAFEVVQNPNQVTSPTNVPPTKVLQEKATPTTATKTSTAALSPKQQQTNINHAFEGVVQNPHQVTSPKDVPPTKLLQEKATLTCATKSSKGALALKHQQTNINLTVRGVVQETGHVTSSQVVPTSNAQQKKDSPGNASKTTSKAVETSAEDQAGSTPTDAKMSRSTKRRRARARQRERRRLAADAEKRAGEAEQITEGEGETTATAAEEIKGAGRGNQEEVTSSRSSDVISNSDYDSEFATDGQNETAKSFNNSKKVKPSAVTTASPFTVPAMQQRGVTSSAVNHQATPLTYLNQSAVMAANSLMAVAPINQWPIDYLLPDNARVQKSILVNYSQEVPNKNLYQMSWQMEYESSAYDLNNVCAPLLQQNIILPTYEPNMQKTYHAEALAVVPSASCTRVQQKVPAPNINRQTPTKTQSDRKGVQKTSQEKSLKVMLSTQAPRETAIQPATCTEKTTTVTITPTAVVPLKHQQTNINHAVEGAVQNPDQVTINHAVEGAVQNPDQVTSPTNVPPTKLLQEKATPTTANSALPLKHQETNINLAVEGDVPPTKEQQEKATPTIAMKTSKTAAQLKHQQTNISLAVERVVQNPHQVTSPKDVPPITVLQEKATPTSATKVSMAAIALKHQETNITFAVGGVVQKTGHVTSSQVVPKTTAQQKKDSPGNTAKTTNAGSNSQAVRPKERYQTETSPSNKTVEISAENQEASTSKDAKASRSTKRRRARARQRERQRLAAEAEKRAGETEQIMEAEEETTATAAEEIKSAGRDNQEEVISSRSSDVISNSDYDSEFVIDGQNETEKSFYNSNERRHQLQDRENHSK